MTATVRRASLAQVSPPQKVVTTTPKVNPPMITPAIPEQLLLAALQVQQGAVRLQAAVHRANQIALVSMVQHLPVQPPETALLLPTQAAFQAHRRAERAKAGEPPQPVAKAEPAIPAIVILAVNRGSHHWKRAEPLHMMQRSAKQILQPRPTFRFRKNR